MDQNIKDCFKKSLDETAIPSALYKKYSVKKAYVMKMVLVY